jgi:oligopeptide/dipeptide ABC transporter ATP-binding protein
VNVRVHDLTKHFHTPHGTVRAVDGVSFAIPKGQTLGLVGESGSGKSTVGRCLLRLVEPTAGQVRFGDTDPLALRPKALRAWRARSGMVFQDPYESVNPRMSVADIITEPLVLHTGLSKADRLRRAGELMELVRLERRHLGRYPHELSGGQLQRVGIARALSTDPEFLVLDEPTSSLDLSVRAGILALLRSVQAEAGVTYLLISHDLDTVAAYCHDVAIMYLGRLVETGPTAEVFEHPQHPYTQALLSAVLPPDPSDRRTRIRLRGEIPSPIDPPAGCRFATRCPLVRDDCLPEPPRLRGDEHQVACVRADDHTNLIAAR